MLYWWKMTAMWHEWWHEERWIESRKTCDAQDLKASEEAWLTNHLNIIFCWTMFARNSSAAVHTAYYYFAISTSFGSSSTSSLRQKPTLHHLPLDNHRYLIRVSVQREWRSEIKRKGELDDGVVQTMKIHAQLRKFRANFMANITSRIWIIGLHKNVWCVL